jgi:hypothetical protein
VYPSKFAKGNRGRRHPDWRGHEHRTGEGKLTPLPGQVTQESVESGGHQAQAWCPSLLVRGNSK